MFGIMIEDNNLCGTFVWCHVLVDITGQKKTFMLGQ